MWQQLFAGLKDSKFMIVAVAEAARGADACRQWIEQAQPKDGSPAYWSLIDTEGTVAELYAMVNVPDDVVRPLLGDFAAQTDTRAEIVYTGNDPFAAGREGTADLVISHYGHEGVEPFITYGYGLWPHAVFANQIALLGPPGDPAHVRGLTDAAEAMRRIA